MAPFRKCCFFLDFWAILGYFGLFWDISAQEGAAKEKQKTN
jgi:hypothetical protein